MPGGRSLLFPWGRAHGCPWGQRVMCKKVIGIKGARAAAPSQLGEIEVSAGSGEGRAGRESADDTCAPEQGGEASGWLGENKIK